LSLRPIWAKLATPCLKNKGAGEVAQVVEHLISCAKPWIRSPELKKIKRKCASYKRSRRSSVKIWVQPHWSQQLPEQRNMLRTKTGSETWLTSKSHRELFLH
jgi:hypothetical protein